MASGWRPDRELEGYESLELPFADDYDGPVVATLVRLPVREASRGAVLYIHGFADYFFQAHMGLRFAAEGFAFYALDLRKHGRSLRPHQHPNFCKSISEYYADITRALEEIGEPVLLAGHSTGALVSSLYAKDGPRRDAVRALWLNSPFFDWKLPEWRLAHLHLGAALGRFFPFLKDESALREDYVRSLIEAGWRFDPRLKPVRGFPIFYGWLGAICDAHARVQRGLGLTCPVLCMHSDEADIVLRWQDMARCSRKLGERVSVLAFPGALHDLVLSAPAIREEVFRQLFAWAERDVALEA